MKYFSSIKNKSLGDLSIDEMAYIHLTAQEWGYEIQGGVIKSGLAFLINEINHVKINYHSNNLVPIISSFTILDQLGSCYKRNDITEYSIANASGVKRALYNFCGLGDESEDIKALYALRNSLLHNGSLLSKGQNKNSSHYTFAYDRGLSQIIAHSHTAWDGNFSNLNYQTMITKVNPEKLISIAQMAIKEATEFLNQGKLEVILPEKQIEMYYRFLNFIPNTN